MRNLPKGIKYVIGIDEAGRGPLAGPVSVGVVAVKASQFFGRQKTGLLSGIKDSKQLFEKEREEFFEIILSEAQEGNLFYAHSFSSNTIIDGKGIVPAVRSAIKRCLTKLDLDPKKSLVLLDGSLKAPEEFCFQETIIKGDGKEPIIGLASIVAKVTRDRHMKKLAKKYPSYDFHLHKGYGTRLHYEKLRQYGFSKIHRLSFLKKF
jgi:ribonuclease HII